MVVAATGSYMNLSGADGRATHVVHGCLAGCFCIRFGSMISQIMVHLYLSVQFWQLKYALAGKARMAESCMSRSPHAISYIPVLIKEIVSFCQTMQPTFRVCVVAL